MQQSEIETAVTELLANITGHQPPRIHRDLHFEVLGLDSLSKIDLAIAVEDRFCIAIPDEDIERLVAVGDLLEFVQRATAGEIAVKDGIRSASTRLHQPGNVRTLPQ
jgi:acyl carrier protein